MTTVDEKEPEARPVSGDTDPAALASELAGRWEAAVRERRRTRGAPADQPVAFGDGAGLVLWMVSAPAGDVDLPHHLAGALGEAVVARRAEGALLEELLIELGLLQEVLFDAVRPDATRHPPALDGWERAAFATADIARRVGVVSTLVAGMFSDEAELDRREERRKLDGFTRMVSHEMRTPIGAAFTAGRMLEDLWDELPPDERASMLEVVGRGLSRAAHLIESATALAIARDPGRDVDRKPLREVVEDALADVGPAAERAGVRVEVVDSLPAALVDGRRTAMVLGNLLANAVHYAHRGREDRWVRLRVRRATDAYGWRVEVEDNGVGIDPEDHARVFRRFYRARGDLAPGTGLGLVIAREAAEQLGSDISLVSTPGAGSTFTFTVPDEEAPRGEAPGPYGAPATAARGETPVAGKP